MKKQQSNGNNSTLTHKNKNTDIIVYIKPHTIYNVQHQIVQNLSTIYLKTKQKAQQANKVY